jgi:hypothetical protein
MAWVYDDGGRAAAGYKGDASDCVARAIAIATERPYAEVLARVAEFADGDATLGAPRKRTAYADRGFDDLLREWGWYWQPTMRIGQGCQTHLRADELPKGRIIARVSRHLCAVIDGVVHDTHDPSRNGTRCVYGYYRHD